MCLLSCKGHPVEKYWESVQTSRSVIVVVGAPEKRWEGAMRRGDEESGLGSEGKG